MLKHRGLHRRLWTAGEKYSWYMWYMFFILSLVTKTHNRAAKLKYKTCTMDGARSFNSAIHFKHIPWIIRSDNDENMKYFTKRSLKFFSRYWFSIIQLQQRSTNSWSSLSFLEISSPTVVLNRFQHAPESSLERRQNIYHLYKTTYDTSAISCWWYQTN